MRLRGAAGAILVAVSATEATAQCNPSSLQGTYLYNDIFIAEDSDIDLCVFEINASGTIVQVQDPTGFEECPVQRFIQQTFAINPDCSVTLTDATGREYIGQISVDRNVSGIGRSLDIVSIFFNLVRE